jgi:quercetin dioxygenase-like cupin family protein
MGEPLQSKLIGMHAFNLDKSKARRVDDTTQFEGEVYQQRLVGPDESDEVGFMAVWFDNGARALPHVHHNDQVLHFVDGTGEVADESGRRTVEAGEVVMVDRGKGHWHGAAVNHSTLQITVKKPGDTDWNVPKRDWDQR